MQVQLKKKLEEVIQNPKIPASRLRPFENHDKIKLKSSGYRLVYEVMEKETVVLVIAIGKREGNRGYEVAKLRTCPMEIGCCPAHQREMSGFEGS